MDDVKRLQAKFYELLRKCKECCDPELRLSYIHEMKEILFISFDKIYPTLSDSKKKQLTSISNRCFMKLLEVCIALSNDEYSLRSVGMYHKKNVYELMVLGKKEELEYIFPNLSEPHSVISKKILNLCNDSCVIFWNSPIGMSEECISRIHFVGYEVLAKNAIYFINPTEGSIHDALSTIYASTGKTKRYPKRKE